MISCSSIEKDVIRRHYDVSTFFYRLLWGRHIHHGLWDGNESPQRAAQQLTERLAREAGIIRGSRVLDIGCGMGGSSIYLASELACRVTGVTLSPFQRRWASMAARFGRTGGRADFLCADAERVDFPAGSADVVWSVECTEHLFDKPAFFRRAAEWLKPGGRMAICVWFAGDGPLTAAQEQLAHGVCEGFFCPSFGSEAEYRDWMTSAGLTVTASYDWTARVSRTWEICRDRVNRWGIHRVAHWIDPGQIIFLDRFQMLLDAYNTGAMKYGCLIAEKR